jgi:hypothetical protein
MGPSCPALFCTRSLHRLRARSEILDEHHYVLAVPDYTDKFVVVEGLRCDLDDRALRNQSSNAPSFFFEHGNGWAGDAIAARLHVSSFQPVERGALCLRFATALGIGCRTLRYMILRCGSTAEKAKVGDDQIARSGRGPNE